MVISHDLAVVKYLADRIAVMYLGKIVELGTGDDIYRRPAHPYTEALIKTIPMPDPAAERAKSDVGHPRRAPEPDHPAVGVSLQDPLPARAGPVRRGGAAAAPVRADATGGVPLPAAASPTRPPSAAGPNADAIAGDPHRLQDERLDLGLVAEAGGPARRPAVGADAELCPEQRWRVLGIGRPQLRHPLGRLVDR